MNLIYLCKCIFSYSKLDYLNNPSSKVFILLLLIFIYIKIYDNKFISLMNT